MECNHAGALRFSGALNVSVVAQASLDAKLIGIGMSGEGDDGGVEDQSAPST